MYKLKNLLTVLAGITALSSCQKNYKIDWGSDGDKASVALKDTLGNCYPIVVSGGYTKGNALTDSNYFLIPILVASEGSYVVSSNSVNGFHFKDSGVVSNIGSQTIKVRAAETPITPSRTDFTLTLGTSVCSFSVFVTD